MQDRFRFRYWDEELCAMRDGDIGLAYDGTPFVVNDDCDNPITCLDNIIIMQCTGLEDKNGKLIYEGDIVEFYSQSFLDAISRKGLERRIGKVVWNDEYLKFDVVVKNNAIPNLCKATDDNNFIVIGNIYENKELLESEEE